MIHKFYYLRVILIKSKGGKYLEYLKEKEMMISRMRQALCKIIGDEGNSLDREVISACRRLNFALNEYNELLRRTIK